MGFDGCAVHPRNNEVPAITDLQFCKCGKAQAFFRDVRDLDQLVVAVARPHSMDSRFERDRDAARRSSLGSRCGARQEQALKLG